MKTLFALLIFSSLTLQAAVKQTDSDSYSKVQVSAELLGPVLLAGGGLSYRPLEHIALNLGVGYFSFSLFSETIKVWTFPVTASYLWGGDSSFLDMFVGADFIAVSGTYTTSDSKIQKNASSSGAIGILGLGYRYWPKDSGFHFKLAANVLFREDWLFWPGISLGYAF